MYCVRPPKTGTATRLLQNIHFTICVDQSEIPNIYICTDESGVGQRSEVSHEPVGEGMYVKRVSSVGFRLRDNKKGQKGNTFVPPLLAY